MHLFTFAHIAVNSATSLQPAPTSLESYSVLMIPWVCSQWGDEQNLVASGTNACPVCMMWDLKCIEEIWMVWVWGLRACEIAVMQWHCDMFDFTGNLLLLSCNFWTSIPFVKTEISHLFHLNTLRKQLFCCVINVAMSMCTLYSLYVTSLWTRSLRIVIHYFSGKSTQDPSFYTIKIKVVDIRHYHSYVSNFGCIGRNLYCEKAFIC